VDNEAMKVTPEELGRAHANAFNAHRERHRLPVGTSSPEAEKRAAYRQRAVAWTNAIRIIDQTEPKIRDLIERELMEVASIGGRVVDVESLVQKLVKDITTIRFLAIKKAFRLVRDTP
jgi:hypothetical protein